MYDIHRKHSQLVMFGRKFTPIQTSVLRHLNICSEMRRGDSTTVKGRYNSCFLELFLQKKKDILKYTFKIIGDGIY